MLPYFSFSGQSHTIRYCDLRPGWKYLTISFLLLLMLSCCISFAQLNMEGNNTPIRKNRSVFTTEDSLKYIRFYRTAKILSDNEEGSDSALLLFRQALAICRKNRYEYGIIISSMAISKIYMEQSAVQKALYLLKLQETHIRANNYYALQIELNIRKAMCYRFLGNTDSAIHCYFQVLVLLQKHPDADPDKKHYAKTCFELGAIYMTQRSDISMAIHYLEKVKAIALEKENRNWLASSLIAIGGAYANSNKPYMQQTFQDGINKDGSGYRKGITYIQQALALRLDDSFPILAKQAYLFLSAIYTNMGKPDSAIIYIKEALAIKSTGKLSNQNLDIKLLATLGAIYINTQQYNKAASYLLKARKYDIETNNSLYLSDIDKSLYLLYAKTGQYTKALHHLESYTFIRDTLMDANRTKALTELEVKYRTSEKDKLLAEKNLSLIRQKSSIKEKNLWIAVSTLSTLLLSIVLFLLRRNHLHWRKRQEEQLQLWQQGEEIRNLKALIYGEEKERARIGHELHDGIIGQLSAAKINFTMLQDKCPMPQPDFNEAVSYLDETVRELRKTAHNLMPGILIERGLMAAIDTYCEKISTFTGIQINVHQEGPVPPLDTDFELSIYRMVQELVQNIIKHANATKVLVQLDCHDSLLILTVEDNGRGIVPDEITNGTGLTNMKTRVRALQGNMDITGSPGQGTSVYIELDISLIKRDRALCP